MTLLNALATRGENLWLRNVAAVQAGSALLWLSAKVAIPFWPVPLTLQTLVVIGLGFALGPVLGPAAVAAYLAEGALGLPVFAGTPEKGVGLAYMVGPTGGYLAGYLLAVTLTGHLARRGWDRNVFSAFAAAIAGGAILYVPGLLWLSSVVGWDKPVLDWGFWPFVYGDLLKAALAAGLFPAIWTILVKKGLVQ